MASATVSNRRARAYAARQAAKQRRQMIFVCVGFGLLIVILIYESFALHLLGGGSSSSSTSAPILTTPVAPAAPSAPAEVQSPAFKAALRHPPRDLFVPGKVTGPPTTLGVIPNPPGLHDPFAQPGTAAAVTAPPVAKVAASPLPSTIVIGKPGGGRIAVSGWIVILASIPTSQGESSATSFATAAGKRGIGKVSVLNSSNRRPLRGGYWVVYTGPYASLAKVNTASSHVHSSGFTTAYIRQLIVYRKK